MPPYILPLSLVVLTSISLAFCIIIMGLSFFNLDLIWVNLVAGAATALYHLLVIVLAWYRTHKNNHTRVSSPTVVTALVSEARATVPYPIASIAFGILVFSLWIIAFSMTTDIAIKGRDSMLISSQKSPLDHNALIGSSLAISAEIVTIALFIWYCSRGQMKTNSQERDVIEERLFYPASPSLSRAGTLRSLYSARSAHSGRERRGKTPPPPLPSLNPLPPVPSITRQNLSPWENITPVIPPTPIEKPRTIKLSLEQEHPNISPPITPLRKPPVSWSPKP
ncbi:hypothetical protein P691DRAFT_777280 [Macrolepiota fuliginosa MF-IS2]|uniref:Uncharacterized protein n=1 Tax=Macrolepiota fuliginosa MF-IS2 TaxID=1400762 RepID=A0A9P5X7E8_9AGAR|nr:hypothetical protein P691DRAFT_777280 [Macrolepiota fuliginosa MF-IS2]